MASISDLRYDFKDILKAPRVALSGKNLLAQARPLFIGYLLYLVFTYLALVADGETFSNAWQSHGLLPLLGLDLEYWYSYALWIAGFVAIAVAYDLGNLTVGKLAFEELRGDYFFPRKEAAKDARGNLLPFYVSGGLLVILIIVLAAIQGLVSLVGLIPVVGEVLYAVLYIVPFFLWSLFLVFLAFGLATSVFTLPAIIVAREKEAFGATFFIFNIIWTRPLRWLTMTVSGVVLAKLGIWVMGYFFMRALQLSNYLTSWFGGEKIQNILASAYGMLDPAGWLIRFITTLYPGSSIGYDWIRLDGQSSASGAEYAAALIIAFGLMGILAVIISYGINIITCSQLLAFIHITFAEDRIKLPEDPSKRAKEPNEIIPEKPLPDTSTS